MPTAKSKSVLKLIADLELTGVEAAQQKPRNSRTILFVDEIHRWNKAQQDGLLPHVESGTITPDRPFECRGYLTSPDEHRCMIFRLFGATHGQVNLSTAMAQSCGMSDDLGAACATGLGEGIIRRVGCYEALMRRDGKVAAKQDLLEEVWGVDFEGDPNIVFLPPIPHEDPMLASAYAAVQSGVTRLDSSVGGLGGCPFAPGATGNIATEDLVYLLRDSDIDTGINLDLAIDAAMVAQRVVGHELPSALLRAGDRLLS